MDLLGILEGMCICHRYTGHSVHRVMVDICQFCLLLKCMYLINMNIEWSNYELTFFGFRITICKRISCIALRTCASWSMVYHGAQCPDSTRSWTGIYTFFSYASLAARTFWIDGTFGFTIRWGSYVTLTATTGGWSTNIATFRVWTAWWWETWVNNLRWRC